jgi:glucose/arabinose dehydrogenase
MPFFLILSVALGAGCARDSSGPQVVNLPPVASITAPAPGGNVAQGAEVVLMGGAADPEDGILSGPALSWLSSLDGTLGQGDSLSLYTLSPGAHTITLRATDQNGGEGTATVQLTVTTVVPGFGLQEVVRGLSEPIFLTHAPGDATRLFVVEKTGRIRIIQNGTLLPAVFLDLRDSVSSGGEQGLLGMAVAPDYATSGRFVVSYTAPRGRLSGGTSVIARYTVSSGNPNLADPTSGHTLLEVEQPYDNHNGGMVAFGPDGFLYIGLGDGGGGGDPLDTGQDRSDLLGSLLRIDVSGTTGYVVPPSNPYAGGSPYAPELWNWGLRNPWRFSFDRNNGNLYIGDVGQNSREEISVAPASSTGGENYGWNELEGTICYRAGCDPTGTVLPVLDYDHGIGCSVTGGYVYRGSAIPSLVGHYLYADYCSGWVRSFQYSGGQAVNRQDQPTLSPGGNITSFGEDATGELYVLTHNGVVYRIVPR